jgi:hypothetical protein
MQRRTIPIQIAGAAGMAIGRFNMNRQEDVFPKSIEVVAYSGYKANERPISFTIHGREYRINSLVDRWYGEDHDYHKVLADDGKIYILRWDRVFDSWSLVKVMEKIGKH